ncbi:MAG: phenylacetic acid degradation operon negative regulatory protein [Paracoccaceae bacterium]|jgi:phenylacetic acid degradation operon negative regulatory protein
MDPLAPLINALHSEGRLRVWSLVITAFGDLVQTRGGAISTARLGQLLGRVGVEPGTLRTALSRLGRDGWVESERKGRTSIYRLSAQGLARFAPATTRIYGQPRTGRVDKWAISLTLTATGAPEVTIRAADEAQADVDCRVVGDLASLSATYRASLMSPAHRSALAALSADIKAVKRDLTAPLDAAAARLLLIHRWRRIVLRFPELPVELMPLDSPLADPRGAVADAYGRISPATEAWLSAPQSGLGPMPPADPKFANRFGGLLQA